MVSWILPGFQGDLGGAMTEHDSLKQRHENDLQEGICAAQQIPVKNCWRTGTLGKREGKSTKFLVTLVTGHGHCAC